ncbi:hypothetical protein IAG41_21150 [Sphingomonas sp. JC676]|uniref:hypothetical protein n=1 Tax=Sphingomonas sp. JC676 TaxID=2768065 RepID=UPI001657688F|nr:hypothetical protein [Sphingomonas sp. JC676]MBC9034907.1 hypothetical protein [Sphingomonas sp. JC676]
MLNPLFAASGLMLLFAAPAVAPEPPVRHGAVAMFQQQHVTIHVPRMTVTSTTIILRQPRLPPVTEKKTSDCVKLDKIAGFTVNTTDSVDLVLNDGSLLRAKLGSECPALGFYSGFYVKPTEDKKLCAGRDSLRSRSGRACPVQAFRTLVVAR